MFRILYLASAGCQARENKTIMPCGIVQTILSLITVGVIAGAAGLRVPAAAARGPASRISCDGLPIANASLSAAAVVVAAVTAAAMRGARAQ